MIQVPQTNQDDERRAAIVTLLAKSGVPANDKVLSSALSAIGITATRETVRGDLAALQREGTVTVEVIGDDAFHVATLEVQQ